MGPATSALFSFPTNFSTMVNANGNVVPGPRLVMSVPETTTGSSEYSKSVHDERGEIDMTGMNKPLSSCDFTLG